VCDCRLGWLTEWLDENGRESTASLITCAEPLQHQGQRLVHIKNKDLKCIGESYIDIRCCGI
jgi:hypothetical protein